jgi:hypothetical protein
MSRQYCKIYSYIKSLVNTDAWCCENMSDWIWFVFILFYLFHSIVFFFSEINTAHSMTTFKVGYKNSGFYCVCTTKTFTWDIGFTVVLLNVFVPDIRYCKCGPGRHIGGPESDREITQGPRVSLPGMSMPHSKICTTCSVFLFQVLVHRTPKSITCSSFRYEHTAFKK